MADYLDRLCQVIAATTLDDIDGATIDHAGLVIAYTLACICAGSAMRMRALALRVAPRHEGRARAIGHDVRAEPSVAAFLNAAAGPATSSMRAIASPAAIRGCMSYPQCWRGRARMRCTAATRC